MLEARKLTKVIQVQLPIFLVKDEFGYFSAFCPALNLAGQGRDEEEAMLSFQQMIEIFFEETTRKGTLSKILKELGWTISDEPHPPQTDIPPFLFAKREIAVGIPL